MVTCNSIYDMQYAHKCKIPCCSHGSRSLHVKYSIFLDDKQDGPHQKPRMNQGVRAG